MALGETGKTVRNAPPNTCSGDVQPGPHNDMGDVTGCATSTRTHSAEQREETRRLTSSVNGQIFKKIAWQGESHDDACGAGCCRLVACSEFFLRLLQFHPVSSSCQRDSACCTMLCRGLSDCLMALHILSRSGISFLGRSHIKPFHSWVILATNPRFGSTHPVRGDSILNSGGHLIHFVWGDPICMCLAVLRCCKCMQCFLFG